jgi:sulfotransferase 6B1
LPKDVWTLERFGLMPPKLRYRVISDQQAPRVLSVSLPKAGTHLLERALCLHPSLYRKLVPTVWPEALDRRWGSLAGLLRTLSPGQITVAHIPFEEGYPQVLARMKATALFMIRDPRDIALSEAHYVVKHPEHPYYQRFAEVPDLRGRIALAIDGDRAIGLESIIDRLDLYQGWLRGSALVVRFEDLVGPEGGGDVDRQRHLVEAIYRHLGVDAGPELVERACSRLFSSDSPTFRRGAIGGWRTQFDDELLDHFRTAVGDLAERYGYLD